MQVPRCSGSLPDRSRHVPIGVNDPEMSAILCACSSISEPTTGRIGPVSPHQRAPSRTLPLRSSSQGPDARHVAPSPRSCAARPSERLAVRIARAYRVAAPKAEWRRGLILAPRTGRGKSQDLCWGRIRHEHHRHGIVGRLILICVGWQLGLLARNDALEPVPLSAAQVLQHPGRRPARRHDRAVPCLAEALDDGEDRFALGVLTRSGGIRHPTESHHVGPGTRTENETLASTVRASHPSADMATRRPGGRRPARPGCAARRRHRRCSRSTSRRPVQPPVGRGQPGQALALDNGGLAAERGQWARNASHLPPALTLSSWGHRGEQLRGARRVRQQSFEYVRP